jgi:hypothetical protein
MAMMILPPRYVMLDTNGDPISGGKVRVYDAGTTDDRDIFTDSALSVAAANPIIADSGGVLPVRYTATGEVKLVFLDASDNVLLTADDVDGGIPAGAGALPVADGGTGATTAAGARTNLSAASQTEVTSIASDVSQLQTDVATAFTGDSGSGGAVGVVPAPAAGDAAADKFLGAAGAWKHTQVVRIVHEESTTDSTVTALTPADDTTPLVSEGTELLTASITPKADTHTILVEFSIPVQVSTTNSVTAHVHVNGGTNAAYAVNYKASVGVGTCLIGRFEHSPATTSAVTFALRIGTDTSGNVFVLRNSSGNRLYGGAARMTMTLTELRA